MQGSARLDAGTRIGEYTIVGLIGAGGMGEVYRARDARLGRDIAIKVLPRELANDRDRLARIQREARTAGMLNHPNLLTVHELGVEDGMPYIVTEVLEGKSLRAVLDGGPLPPRKVIDYGTGIANGLSAAHERGIVHRDLKPENIFVTKDGRVKILDFGLAKIIAGEDGLEATSAGLTERGAIVGTTGYLSPEQARGERLDGRSDIFALGAILYEMLAGRRAFRGDSRAETIHAILKEDPPPLTPVSPALQRVVRHCLEKQPAERFQCARDLAFALESSYDVAPSQPARRRGPLFAIVAAAAILAIAAIGGWIVLRSRSRPLRPTIERLTFRNSNVTSARFTADGHTILYSFDPGIDTDVYAVRTDHRESKPFGFHEAGLLSVSSAGELLLKLRAREATSEWGTKGTLARVYLNGTVPREVLADVEEADWDPVGSKVAIARQVGEKYRVEFPIGTVLYETTGWVSSLRVSPDGNAIAFVDHPLLGDDAGSVAVVQRNRELRRVGGTYNTALGLAWRPDGREVWFTAGSEQRSLRAIDLQGHERTLYVAPGLMTLLDISPDGGALVTLATHELKIAFARADDQEGRDLSWQNWSIVNDLSPDGRSLLFGEGEELLTRGTDGSQAVKIGEGWEGRFSPDGRSVLATSLQKPSQLIVYPIGAGEARQVTHEPLQHRFACWSPDGTNVVFEAIHAKGGEIRVQSLAGGPSRRVGPAGFALAGDAVSPDGHTILVRSGERIGLLPMEGGQPRMLPDTLARANVLRWNRQGSGFYFCRGRSSKVYEYDLATNQIRSLPFRWPDRQLAIESAAAITADGRALAVTHALVMGDLYVMSGLE